MTEVDKKILTQLDISARANLKELARKIRSPYHVVSYRFEQLIKNGIIKKFVTEFGLGKLGYFVYKIFFQLKGLTKEREEEFFSYLVKHEDIIWVAKCEGRWDLMIAIYAKDVIEFSKIKDEIFRKYGDLIAEYDTTIIKEVYILKRSYLLYPNESRIFPKNYKQEFYIAGNETVRLDESDKKILKLIPDNARFKLIDLTKKAKLNVKTVSSKLKKLEAGGVVQGYTILINLNRIGYKFYKMIIYLQDIGEESYASFMKFCKRHPNIIHLIEAIGPWEIELEIETFSDKEYYELGKAIRNKFPGIVKKIESVFISDEMKLVYLPARL